ncbi:unnamed protein product [Lymnaea stagnalis]|uniref:Doublecortin-like and CAM kinase-like protein n=1 Tax=Lymnaea stagnalis TaxID=6523 RepID=A0AAV2HVD9_LYMST
MGETGLSMLPKGDGQQNDNSASLDRASISSPSPQNTDKGSVKSGHSLLKMATEKRARKVRFYRNGDRFFKGMVYAVSAGRFRTFEGLLTMLTSSALCDKKVMPNGVRHIFSVDGTRKVEALEQLQEGESYVCASSEVFRHLDYCKNEDPSWNSHLFPHHVPTHNVPRHQHRERITSEEPRSRSECLAAPSYSKSHQSQQRPCSAKVDRSKTARSHSLKNEMTTEEKRAYEEYQRTFVTPRLITIIRNGRRPRKSVRLLLNKKTAQSYDQVMADIAEVVKLDCGCVKKLFSLTGRQVSTLADFFQEDTVFLACGLEKINATDFNLDKREIGYVNAYRPSSGKPRERITLQKSGDSAYLKSSAAENNSSTSSSMKDSRLFGTSDGKHSTLKSDEKSEDKERFDISKVDMPISLTNKYEVGNLIGTGNFAVVLECKDKKSQRKYALKIINKEICKGKEKMIDNEVRILRCVKHPNIIRLIEDYSNQHQIFYVMELVKASYVRHV